MNPRRHDSKLTQDLNRSYLGFIMRSFAMDLEAGMRFSLTRSVRQNSHYFCNNFQVFPYWGSVRGTPPLPPQYSDHPLIGQPSPPENDHFLTTPESSRFSRFQIGSLSLISNYGDIERHSISQRIKIIQATSVISYSS